ncbi:MAG: isochorismatase family protein [Bacillus sp. (in: firmicutes)]
MATGAYGKVLLNLLALKKRAKQHNVPVIYINVTTNCGRLINKKLSIIVQMQKTKITLKLLYRMMVTFFNQAYVLCFFETTLHTLLHQLKTRKLIISGIAGNLCVLFTANVAYMRHYKLYCPADCITSADSDDNTYTLFMMENV